MMGVAESDQITLHVNCSPAVLGLIWHVTDLDLDRLTSKCLSSWLDLWSTARRADIDDNRWGALIKAKRNGRSACLLRLITGGACINFGLPF